MTVMPRSLSERSVTYIDDMDPREVNNIILYANIDNIIEFPVGRRQEEQQQNRLHEICGKAIKDFFYRNSSGETKKISIRLYCGSWEHAPCAERKRRKYTNRIAQGFLGQSVVYYAILNEAEVNKNRVWLGRHGGLYVRIPQSNGNVVMISNLNPLDRWTEIDDERLQNLFTWATDSKRLAYKERGKYITFSRNFPGGREAKEETDWSLVEEAYVVGGFRQANLTDDIIKEVYREAGGRVTYSDNGMVQAFDADQERVLAGYRNRGFRIYKSSCFANLKSNKLLYAIANTLDLDEKADNVYYEPYNRSLKDMRQCKVGVSRN